MTEFTCAISTRSGASLHQDLSNITANVHLHEQFTYKKPDAIVPISIPFAFPASSTT
ncbi:hypothetical protein KR51_00032430 [Rubidibacter lacunae KORDI 51-2]|uniref:Uncharacterized protein n=1 Tax=Rubidibacter lacunae KORDI 51-2 TaxID=582515 RepID=U5DG96_9CHRO|nr:hypothetical protein KR51_00032430 [Rubidibacter lacunae KORDI 51-2]